MEFAEDILDAFERYLGEGDPIGDAAAGELRDRSHWEALERSLVAWSATATAMPPHAQAVSAFLEEVTAIPPWLNRDAFPIASRLFFRAGQLGGTVLAFRSLLAGYISPAGNKPLTFSGRLTADTSKRLLETARFVVSIYSDGGLAPGGPGLRSATKVRLMHSNVRRALRSEKARVSWGEWNEDRWGHPINQFDMAATILLFSTVFLDGLMRLGFHVSHDEREAVQHVWRYIGTVMGVHHALLPSSYEAGLRHFRLITLVEGAPDKDSTMLVASLLRAPVENAKSETERRRLERNRPLILAIASDLLGADRAAEVGIPHPGLPARAALLALRQSVHGIEQIRERSSRLSTLAERLGRAHWQTVIEGRTEQFGDFWSA
ncbi:MAG: DUF2236 domain-containing protein, partial [Polyangiaceae bacterium]|nr:DUF2236 domain-containing protein [Polyangiaceae bacterium]